MSDTSRAGYADIATHYRRLIADGTLAPGDAMPSMREVCEQFGTSIATVNRAFQMLKAEELTTAKPGRGTVVAEPPRVAATGAARLDRIGRTGKRYAYKETSTQHQAMLRSCADGEIAKQLGIEPHDEIVLRTRVFRKDGTPTIVAVSCINMRALAHVPELLDPAPLPRFWQEIYTERTGRTVTRSPERRTARLASADELDALGISAPPGSAFAVLVLVNVFHDDQGPIEVWEDVYSPGLVQVDSE